MQVLTRVNRGSIFRGLSSTAKTAKFSPPRNFPGIRYMLVHQVLPEKWTTHHVAPKFYQSTLNGRHFQNITVLVDILYKQLLIKRHYCKYKKIHSWYAVPHKLKWLNLACCHGTFTQHFTVREVGVAILQRCRKRFHRRGLQKHTWPMLASG